MNKYDPEYNSVKPESLKPFRAISFSIEAAEKLVSKGILAPDKFEGFRIKKSVHSYGLINPFINKEEATAEWIRECAYSKSMSLCGITPIPSQELGIGLWSNRETGQVFTGFSGLATCNNALCPTCNSVMTKERREIVKRTLFAAQKSNLEVILLTFTTPKNGTPAERIKALKKAQTYIVSNNARKWLSRRGNDFYEHSSSLDLTINENNRDPYHYHYHTLLIVEKNVAGFKDYLWKQYQKIMARLGFGVHKKGFDFKPIDTIGKISNYLNKTYGNLAVEHTSRTKGTKSKSLGIFEFFEAAAMTKTPKQYGITKQILRDTAGLRWWNCSRGFKKLGEDLMKEKEEQIDKVFFQSFSKNFWYALNGVEGARAAIRDLLLEKHNNPKGDHSKWEALEKLMKSSCYEREVSPRWIEVYELEITRILGGDCWDKDTGEVFDLL